MPGLRLELRLSEELVGKLDAARGLVPRATFARDALERALSVVVESYPVPGGAGVPAPVVSQVEVGAGVVGPWHRPASAEVRRRG